MKPSRFPDALVLIFAMIVLAQLLTYLLPSGEFDREGQAVVSEQAYEVTVPAGATVEVGERALEAGLDDTMVVLPAGTRSYQPGRKVIPGSYHRVEAAALPWHATFTKIPKGLEMAAEIIFFVMVVGGVIEVIKKTGAIDAMIGAAIDRLGERPMLLTAGMMTLFAVGSSTIGMAEEYMPFIPILVAMCIALNMDAIVAMGIVYIGAGVGYGAAALNPFTVMIAKDIAGQPASVGMGLRWGLLAVMIVIGVHHLMAYARRVKADATASLVADVDYSVGYAMPEDVEFTGRRIVVLAAFVAMIVVFVVGVFRSEWYLVELAALFLGMAVIATIVGRLTPNAAARAFVEGAASLSGTAMLIGFARTIEVVLTDAKVIDTVIHSLATLLNKAEGLGSFAAVVSAWGMLLVQSVCNFLVPSGSAQAYVTMPVMAPLADLTGVGRETSILAYQIGDGLMNMIVPTNALLMGMLLLARVPYQRWLRFVLPLMLKLYVVALIVLAWAAIVHLQ